MIVFEGNPSKEVRRFIMRVCASVLVPLAVAFLLVGFIPLICYLAGQEELYYLALFLVTIMSCGAIGAVVMIFPLAIAIYPKRVTIESDLEDGLIETTFLNRKDGKTMYTDIGSIVKVVDYGNFYYLRPRVGRYFCQKDLLTEGTLEEFEKLFEEIIVRKK